MKLRWSFRAANDRSAQFAQESNPTVSAKEGTYLFKGRCFNHSISFYSILILTELEFFNAVLYNFSGIIEFTEQHYE